MVKLKRELIILPAFDRRSTDPNKNYGIHGAEMRWYVKGKKGIIQFILYTNWQLPNVTEGIFAEANDPHLRFWCKPLPADIGYHSPVPMYEGQTANDCDMLPSGKCYYDGSSLGAEEYFNILVAKGGEALWLALEKEYKERLCSNQK